MTGNIILARKRHRRVSQRVKNICRSIRSDVHRPLFENENQKEEYSTAIFASLFVWIAKKNLQSGRFALWGKVIRQGQGRSGRLEVPFLQYKTQQTALYAKCTDTTCNVITFKWARDLFLRFYSVREHFSKPSDWVWSVHRMFHMAYYGQSLFSNNKHRLLVLMTKVLLGNKCHRQNKTIITTRLMDYLIGLVSLCVTLLATILDLIPTSCDDHLPIYNDDRSAEHGRGLGVRVSARLRRVWDCSCLEE